MSNPIVRRNLMEEKGYSPYCGNDLCEAAPRTNFDGTQFKCPRCGWYSQFPGDFIDKYVKKWKFKQ